MIRSHKLLFCLLALFLSCGTPDQAPEEEAQDVFKRDLKEIKEAGKIIALTANSTTSYFVYRGQTMGFQYELLSRYANERGLELEIKLIGNMDSVLTNLKQGEGDIVAANLTVTKDRKEKVAFTHPHLTTRQVLVQKLPEQYWKMWRDHIEDSLIRDPIELAGETVVVRKNSSFYDRLKSLSNEIGADINIVEAPGVSTETLIRKVADGEIKYTVADENVAKVNKKFFPNIDARTAISFPQKIAWAVRRNSTELLQDLNLWIDSMKKTSDYHTIHTKYFKARTSLAEKVNSNFNSKNGTISQYDEWIKLYADSINWDWRLLSSLVYQESQFKNSASSFAGARGLMQIMPETAKSYGNGNLLDPKWNLFVGSAYLKRMESFWKDKIPAPSVVKKFAMASYNVGLGHVIDARRLAAKYDKDPSLWEGHVEQMLLNKAKPKYYNDPVVKHGYCRGSEPVHYVKEIFERYEHYKNLILIETQEEGKKVKS